MAREDRPAKAAKARAEDWRLQAACRPLDSDLFFPDRAAYRTSDVARAKAVCRACPVREACLQAAMDGRERVGIWGGLTPQERLKLQRRRRRARDDTARDDTAAAAKVVPNPATEGYPVRDQLRRGVADGWLRVDTARPVGHAPCGS
jgi:WhiB family redox-sensing transcriptional regulator